MESLLKLQPQVIIDSTDYQGVELPKRPISIPASRLADARKNAEINTISSSGTNNMLTVSPSAPARAGRRELVTKTSRYFVTPSVAPFSLNDTEPAWPMSLTSLAAASPAVGKAALVEVSNSKGSLAYPGGAVLPALMTKLSDIERLLYTLLPPKRTVCKETGKTIMQFVSLEPSMRTEVAELHERLIHRLQQRRARNSGICPIRREIYAEVFDELIRQITLEEPARGVLLLRVRDEIYQSLTAHRSLLEQAMYSASKHRVGEIDGLDSLKQCIKDLEENRSKLLLRRKTAQVRIEKLQLAIEQENSVRTKIWQEEFGYYRRANRQLTQRIKAETERANANGTTLNIPIPEEAAESTTSVVK